MATVITLSPEQLSALIQEAVASALAGVKPAAAATTSVPLSKKSASKSASKSAEPKAKRAPSVWAAWCKHATDAYAEEYAAWRAEHPDLKGPAVQFGSFKRKGTDGEDSEDYKAFVLLYAEDAAERASVGSSSASDSETSSTAAKKRGRPKFTDEQKAQRKAERDAKKTATAATKTTETKATEADDEIVIDLWVHPVSGTRYQRSNQNHLWLDKDGEIGEWQGILDPITLKIDDSADAPDME